MKMRTAEEFMAAKRDWIEETSEACTSNVLKDIEESLEEAYTKFKTFRENEYVYVEKYYSTMRGIMELKDEVKVYTEIYIKVCAAVEEAVKEYGWECKYRNNGKMLCLVPISKK